jgi:hypothetical protein
MWNGFEIWGQYVLPALDRFRYVERDEYYRSLIQRVKEKSKSKRGHSMLFYAGIAVRKYVRRVELSALIATREEREWKSVIHHLVRG